MNWPIFLNWMKNTLLFTCCTKILVRLLNVNMKIFLTQKSENVRLHYSQSICEKATYIQRHIPIGLF